MKKYFRLPVTMFGLLICVLSLIGCNKVAETTSGEEKLRNAYNKKDNKIEDLPPEQQAMVRAMMKSAEENKGKPPVMPKPATAPK